MSDLDALYLFLRVNGKMLQYAVFLGLFVSLGALEIFLSERPAQHGKRWRANLVLTVLCVLTLGLLPVSALMAADFAASRGTGLLNDPAVPLEVAVALGLLLRSLLSFLIHVAFHKSPWLWRFHAVHHTDTAMDVTTSVRMHPLEFVISAAMLLPCIVAFGIPAMAVIFYEIFDAGMAVVTHANLRIPASVDRILRWILVTPDMHRIHHSTWQPETDSNFGATFSFWDRMFGSYRSEARGGDAPEALGLSQVNHNRATALIWLLALPVTGVPGGSSSARHNKLETI